MKLPQVRYRQVQSMGRHNLSTVSAQASADQALGNTIQSAWNAVAKVTGDYIERQENQEYDDQIANFQIELSNWRRQHDAKQFYTSQEIGDGVPESVVPRFVSGTDDEGNATREARDSIPAYEVYPHLLKSKLEGMISEKAGNIRNPNLRNEFLRNANMNAATMIMDSMIKAEQAQQKHLFNVGVDKANDAALAGDFAMAQFLINNLEADDLVKKELNAAAEKTVERVEVDKAIRSTDPETVMQFISMYDDPQYPGNFTEGERQGVVNDLRTRMAQLGAERTAMLAREHETFISDAYAGIDAGTFGLKDIENGFEQWQVDHTNPTSISGRERTALRNALDAANAGRQNAINLAAFGEHLITNGGDYNENDHIKAIDGYVDYHQINDPAKLEQIAFRSGIMPSVLENMLSTMALHDAEKGSDMIPMAVDMAGRMIDSRPHLMQRIGKEARDVLTEAHILRKGGMSQTQAYEVARENARIDPNVKEFREKQYTTAMKDIDVNSVLKNMMDDDDTKFGFEGHGTIFPWSKVTPSADGEMQVEFQNRLKDYYVRTGDMATAKQMAWYGVKETWSPSGVGSHAWGGKISKGPRAFKNSPERVLGVSTEQADRYLDAFKRFHEIDAPVQIGYDATSAREASWPVFVLDPDTNMPTGIFPERWVAGEWIEAGEEWTYQEGVREAQARRASEDAMEAEFIKSQEMIESGPHYRVLVDPTYEGDE